MRERGYGLQTLQHRVGSGYLELACLLDIELLHDAVVDQHRITLRALAEAALGQVELEPDRAGELAAAISQHQHLVADILRLAPGAHHKGIVDRDAGDLIDPLALQVRGLVDIARQVALRAGRGEGARHGEQGNLLAAEQLVGGDLLGAFRAQIFERRRWYLVANLDGHWGGLRMMFATGVRRWRWGRTDSIAGSRPQ